MNGGRPVRVLLALLDRLDGPARGGGRSAAPAHARAALRQARLLDRDRRRLAADALARALRCAGARGWRWGLIGTGSLLWACGDVYWTLVLADNAVIPVPSVSDAGYLAFYPLVFAGLCLLLRARVEGAPKTLWVDGLTAALAAGAMSAAVVLQAVLHTVGGNALGVATNLAYPIGDLILLAVVVAAFALRGWRADRTWALLRPGHRALLDRRLLLPRHRRQRDLRLSEPVGRRLDLVPRALLGRRLAARAPHGGRRGRRRDALHRLPDRLRQPRPGHPRPRRAGLAEPARRRARRRLAARRLRPPGPEPARERRRCS